MLICPHCGAPLVRKDKTFCCESGHSYDIARAGYCNLLQTNKPGDHTGDSKDMVEARRRFLDQGYYEGLAMAMCQQMKNLTKDKADINFVDAGCGEGYYTRQMAAVLHENGKLKESIGVDISNLPHSTRRSEIRTPSMLPAVRFICRWRITARISFVRCLHRHQKTNFCACSSRMA